MSVILAPRRGCKLRRLIVTAVPMGERHWQAKVVLPTDDKVVLSGIYPTRLEALGKAVLIAWQCGGEVWP